MSSWQNDLMIDEAFQWVRARFTRENVCSQLPANYTEATSTYMLAQTGILTSTELVIADGDTNGRKMTMAAQNSVSVTSSGTATHVALTGSTGNTLLLVTACTSQALTSGNTVNIPAWKDEIADVTT